MSDVKQILENLGYKLTNDGFHYYRTKPLYRESNNSTALRVSKKTGWFVDFPRNESGPLCELVRLTLGLKTEREAKSWLSTHEFDSAPSFEEKPKVVGDRTYSKDILNNLVKNHSYWNGRDIPDEIISEFNGGVALSGSMGGRYIFPVFDENDRLVGFAGRDITGKNQVKWMLVGDKKKWAYPSQSFDSIKQRKEVILVESIGDMLALSRAGFKNTLVLFGLALSDKVLSTLVRFNPSRIIVATNNDSANKSAGNKSAEKIKLRLNQFFEEEKIVVHLPVESKDFGEMSDDQINEWYAQAIESEQEVTIYHHDSCRY